MPTSVQTQQPIPPTSPYGISLLYLFSTYTRASFLQAFGVVAPPFNPSWPVKTWFDSAANSNVPTVYYSLETATEGDTQQIVFPPVMAPFLLAAGQANVVNLPNDPTSYSAWVPAPTVAVQTQTLNGVTTTINAVNPNFLSTPRSSKRSIFHTRRTGGVQTWTPAPGNSDLQIQYGAETRRIYYFIDSNNQWQWVGYLLLQEYASGVGAPGQWVSEPATPGPGAPANMWVWQAGVIASPVVPTSQMIPMPMRTLFTDKTIISVSAGMGVMVSNTAV